MSGTWNPMRQNFDPPATPVTLAEFLLARIAEDEQRAHSCAAIYPPPWDMYDRGHSAAVKADAPNFRTVAAIDQDDVVTGELHWLGEALDHIANWDPARVLADCEAKRQIVELLAKAESHQAEVRRTAPEYGWVQAAEMTRDALLRAVQALALAYADHLDYREEWRP